MWKKIYYCLCVEACNAYNVFIHGKIIVNRTFLISIPKATGEEYYLFDLSLRTASLLNNFVKYSLFLIE